jgi:hypothetical protein
MGCISLKTIRKLFCNEVHLDAKKGSNDQSITNDHVSIGIKVAKSEARGKVSNIISLDGKA